MTIPILLFLAGLAILIIASDQMINGAVRISEFFRLSPLFVGLVLVAFGTSAPEAGIGIIAALKQSEGIALGNIIGSNIANIGLILGVSALIRPMPVGKTIFRWELPVATLAVFLLILLCLDGELGLWDGVVMLTCFAVFFVVSYLKSRHTPSGTDSDEDVRSRGFIARTSSKKLVLTYTILMTSGVILGADLMVRGGSSIASSFGVSEWIIGITVFAVGTSLPELAASVSASARNISSISVGNVIGSNIFNLLLVLGIVSVIHPLPISPGLLRFEFPALGIFSLLLFIIMLTGYRITRWEGLLLLASYIGFVAVTVSR